MKYLPANEFRKKWINFFSANNHLILPPVSLVPINDESLLWINAGVSTLKSYFIGKENPPANCLVNCQKCLRTNDIENVGVTSRHQTLFEMLGNFSIGNYFKKEAISFAYKFIINELETDINKIYISVYEKDEESYNYWIELGIDPSHICKGDRNRNFWDLGMGPCGPCTEIFYDRGEKYDPEKIGTNLFFNDIENDRYIEIWNIVFSQFNNDGKNNYTELARKNIDTGAGLERWLSIIQEVPTNFDTDLFQPIFRILEKYTNYRYVIDEYFDKNPNTQKKLKCFRIIADHIRAAIFAISDGVIPANKDRGYIIRKLLRRSYIYALKLNIALEKVIVEIVDKFIDINKEYYDELTKNKENIVKTIKQEIMNFKKTLSHGLTLLNNKLNNHEKLDTEFVFKLVETFGVPVDLIKEGDLFENVNIEFDIKKFDELFQQHKLISKVKQNPVAMLQQNNSIVNLKVKSEFDREHNDILSKVVALFDEDFNTVKKIINKGYIVFDKTVFYATSGGQQHDFGVIRNKRKKIVAKIIDVVKGTNNQHIHFVETTKIKLHKKYYLHYDEQNRISVMKNHTTEHLLQGALKRIIDQNIKQEGAFKSAEKATFDFSYNKKLSEEELQKIEKEIIKIIKLNVPVTTSLKTLEEAKKMNALAYFEDRYAKFGQDKLRVVKIGEFSIELCGGTHTHDTGSVEDFFISDYYSQGNNKWRIEVITGFSTINKTLKNYQQIFSEKLNSLHNKLLKFTIDVSNASKEVSLLKNSIPQDIHETRIFKKKLTDLEEEINKLEIQNIQNIKKETVLFLKNEIIKELNKYENNYFIKVIKNIDKDFISSLLHELTNEFQQIIFVLIVTQDDKSIQYFASRNSKNNLNIKCNEIIEKINSLYQGHGGGKDIYAQGGTKISVHPESIKSEIEKIFIDNNK